MSRKANLLSDAQWEKIFPLLPSVEIPRKKGRPRADDRMVVEGVLYGSCEQELAGKIYQTNIRAHQPVGEDSSDGKKMGFGSMFGERSFRNWIAVESSTGARPLLTGASLRQKKGRGRRKNQEGQRNEVDGGGRWSRYSAGKPYRLCLAR